MLDRLVRSALVLAVLAATAACAGDSPLTSTRTTQEAPEAGQPPGADVEAVERRMERVIFDLVNDERRARGLDELEWDDQLASHAREWSRRMADRGRLEHQDAERMLERADGFTAVGENIFAATGPAPASTIHVGWMRSDGHRANVLRDAFDRLGIGVVCADDGRVWATQRFGGPAGGAMRRPSRESPPQEPIVASEGEGPRCPGSRGDVRIELDATLRRRDR